MDLDGVICNWHPGFLSHYNRVNFDPGVYPVDVRMEPTSWDYTKELGRGGYEKALSTFHEQPHFWESLMAYVSNCDALAAFLAARQDIDVTYLTARPSPSKGPSALVQTNRWLRAQGLLGDATSVIVVPDWKAKVEIAVALQLDLVIDDHPQTVDAMRLKGVNAVLLSRPWNTKYALESPAVFVPKNICEEQPIDEIS